MKQAGWLCLSLVCTCFTLPTLCAEDAIKATESRLKNDISYLASDELKGRDVGSEGIALAGEFIATRFADLGLETDSFDGQPFQDFTIPGPAQMGDAAQNTLRFKVNDSDKELILGEQFNSLSLGNSGSFSDKACVFAGYGISAPDLGYDDYKDIDVKDKVVIVIRKEPQQQNSDSIFDGSRSSQYAFFSSKELNAAVHEVAALIMVNDSISASSADALMRVTDAGAAGTKQQVPTFFCRRSAIDPILIAATGKSLAELEQEIDADLQPRSQELPGVTVSGETLIEQAEIPVRNVVGVLPGKGDLSEEYVVVGAHYDHVGMGGRGSLAPGTVAIHNGADDNASGTTALLEVARRMAADESEHRRSLVFIAFTGEERGLLGSKYYVRNPRWPLENTVAMINMDMVGRLTDNRLTVFGTGTAEGFEDLIDRFNETSNFSLDKQAAGFGPSDHSSFYQAEIPVFHFFTGLHNDYHRPGDDPDKVNYEGIARIADMVTQVTKEISTAESRPAYVLTNAVANVGRGPGRRSRAVIGIELDLDRDGKGAGINSVPADGPAAKAGLQAGDIIMRIDEADIDTVRDLRTNLARRRPGDMIKVTVKRGDDDLVVDLTLGRG